MSTRSRLSEASVVRCPVWAVPVFVFVFLDDPLSLVMLAHSDFAGNVAFMGRGFSCNCLTSAARLCGLAISDGWAPV